MLLLACGSEPAVPADPEVAPNSADLLGIRGPVLMVEEYNYRLEFDGGLEAEIEDQGKPVEVGSSSFQFNERGQLTRESNRSEHHEKEIEYLLDKFGRLTEERMKYVLRGEDQGATKVYSFNEVGRVREIQKFNVDERLIFREVREFDENGRLVAWTYRDYDPEEGETKREHRLFYDHEGNKKKDELYEDDVQISYSTFAGKRLDSVFKVDMDGKPSLEKWYSYEENAPYKKSVRYDDKGKVSLIQCSKINDKGQVVESRILNDMDELLGTYEYWTYDSLGNELWNRLEYGHWSGVDILQDSFAPIDTNTTRYELEYDSHGNWIKEIVYLNSIPSTMTTRKITYR